MKTEAPSLLLAGLLLLSTAMAEPVKVTISLDRGGKPISDALFGIFFEDLNYAADGGLYAELVQNRSFEYSTAEQSAWGPLFGWERVALGGGEAKLGVGDARPVHPNNPHYLLLEVTNPGEGAGVANRGFDALPVEAGKSYRLSFWAYQTFMGIKWGAPGPDAARPMPVLARLEGESGEVLAEQRFEVGGRAWTQYRAEFKPLRSAGKARLALYALKQGGLALDMVSLMPKDTFKGRENGLRRDLAEAIAALQPRFMRFPGGCLVHGPGPRKYYDWKKTVGPLEARAAERNSWGYHQTFGLGYFEYFQLCENLGALPLPVVTAGVCCQHAGDSPGHGQEGLPLEEMKAYVQDVLDLIEWANGPVDSKWGSVRAAAGHPAPFGLKYLGVGNEDAITPDFKVRFEMLFRALQDKHPEIVVVGTSGPFPDGEDFDLGWAFAREKNVPVVDEHYYRSPDWFWDNLQRYDAYDRKGPKVYVGEYAAHDTGRRSTLRTALAEAAFLTSLERNGDHVLFASYAPLLARRGHTQWTPDMIYFNETSVYPTINYEVQRLFGRNRGDYFLETRVAGAEKALRLAVSAVRDSASGDVIVKIVNGTDTVQSVHLALNGLKSGGASAVRTVLTGPGPDAVNSDDGDAVVVPREEPLTLKPQSEQTVAAHSLTVLRLQAR